MQINKDILDTLGYKPYCYTKQPATQIEGVVLLMSSRRIPTAELTDTLNELFKEGNKIVVLDDSTQSHDDDFYIIRYADFEQARLAGDVKPEL